MARRDFISDSSRTSLACALGVLAVLFRMRDLFPGAIRPSCFLGSSRNDHYGLGAGVVARGEIGAGDEPRRRAARVRPAAFLVRTGSSFKIRLVVACSLGAWILARWRYWPRVDSAPRWSATALIAGWHSIQLGPFLDVDVALFERR